MATSIVEALEAARAAGCEDWLRTNLAAEFAEADNTYADRVEEGTLPHAVRPREGDGGGDAQRARRARPDEFRESGLARAARTSSSTSPVTCRSRDSNVT